MVSDRLRSRSGNTKKKKKINHNLNVRDKTVLKISSTNDRRDPFRNTGKATYHSFLEFFFFKKRSFLCRCQTREGQDDGRVALTHMRANSTGSRRAWEGRAWALGTHFSPATCLQSTERFPAQPLTGPSPQWGSPVFQVTLGPLSSTPDLGARGRDAVATETRSVASR